jgi:hypothetical protein
MRLMVEEEKQEQANLNDAQLHGVYTISDIDTSTFFDIEKGKATLIMNLGQVDISESTRDLKNLFGLMKSMLEKYYPDEEGRSHIKQQKVDGYNFYEAKELIDVVSGNTDLLRAICEVGYINYNVLIKPFVSLPTTRKGFKKKLLERIFSLVRKDDQFYDEFINAYLDTLEKLKMKDNKLNFECYCLAKANEFDLDMFVVVIGSARSGKSVLTLQCMIKIYQFRLMVKRSQSIKYILENNIVADQIIYSLKQKSAFQERFTNSPPSIFVFDDSYLTSDRRKAMTKQILFLSHIENTLANKNHITFMLIQNLTDLDRRFLDKSSSLITVKDRGHGKIFAKNKSYPFIKSYYGFERFEKNPNLLASEDLAEYNQDRMATRCGNISWRDLTGGLSKKLFVIYKTNKEKYQSDDIQTMKDMEQEEIESKSKKASLNIGDSDPNLVIASYVIKKK